MNKKATKEVTTIEPAAPSVLAIIERAASSSEIDVDKMERLLAMHERILARDAETAFNIAMRRVQEAMPGIVRDAQNESTHSTYARLETVNRALVPVYTGAGFSLSFSTAECQNPDLVRITCKVSHEAGHSRDYQADVPLDLTGMKGTANKTRTHAYGSTVSYGRRYLTLLIFNASLINEDDDGQASEPITDKQAADLEAMISEVNANRVAFLRYLKVDELEDLPASRFEAAVAALEEKRRRA